MHKKKCMQYSKTTECWEIGWLKGALANKSKRSGLMSALRLAIAHSLDWAVDGDKENAVPLVNYNFN